MASRYVSLRNLKFVLYEVLRAQELTACPYFADHDRQVFDLVLDTALRLSDEMLFPHFADMDRNPPRLEDGQVKVQPAVREFLRAYGEGYWFGANFPYEMEGQQLPVTITTAAHFIMGSANFSGSAYTGLTTGAAHLILSFGSRELQETYVPRMLSGAWQGTMALTEPQAGSSLSDVATLAEPTDQGYYLLRGQKIFISAADHDGVDNVVHLMLARIAGAPMGVKGISLFVVPKLRPEQAGLVPNDLHAAGVFHKLGYRGCPIVQLSLGEEGDCRGWLVGEPHRGLAYMFQMMNEARISVGMQAAACTSGAYYASLQYARERPQGRKVESKDPSQPPVMIIEHADVKRMLLFQRAVVEGSLALLLQAAKYSDLSHYGPQEQRERYALLLDLITPVVKSYPSEMGILSTSTGLQILGGYGYCDEFPLEQYYRDVRIHPIHEGTTGIQAMDLLGRKAVMHQGRALALFREEVEATLQAAQAHDELKPYAQRLRQALDLLQEATQAKLALAAKGQIEVFLADATLYLELFGLVAVAWQWLLQGLAAAAALAGGPSAGEADFYQGKLMTMRYFFHYELPKAAGLHARLLEDDGLTAAMTDKLFAD
ncbi:MAG: acyl-CoA dehydrogenase [Desulfarculus sp.]|nr:MAG: acyl-CoA dehydrogenase [Desulfarculus sp.]